VRNLTEKKEGKEVFGSRGKTRIKKTSITKLRGRVGVNKKKKKKRSLWRKGGGKNLF